MVAGNLNTLVDGVVFRRRVSGVMNRQSLWLSFGILFVTGAICAVVLLAPVPPAGAAAQISVPPPPTHMDINLLMIVVLVPAFVVGCLLSFLYERLEVGPEGIRYTTWLGGPFAFLASFYPSWQVSWEEIADLRLQKRAYGRGGLAWYYVITPKAGPERRLSVLWVRLGTPAEGLGLSLWQLMNKDVAAWKSGIASTELFHLLDLTMRARKSQFPHALIQDE